MGCAPSKKERYAYHISSQDEIDLRHTYSSLRKWIITKKGNQIQDDTFTEEAFIELLSPLRSIARKLYSAILSKTKKGKIKLNDFINFAQVMINYDRYSDTQAQFGSDSKLGILIHCFFNKSEQGNEHLIEISESAANTFLTVHFFI